MDEDNIQSVSSSSESNKAFRQSENGISMGFFGGKERLTISKEKQKRSFNHHNYEKRSLCEWRKKTYLKLIPALCSSIFFMSNFG